MCDASTRGIWADAVNIMFLNGKDHVEGTVEQLARALRCRIVQIQVAFCELKQFDVCEVTMQNECTKLTCRRLKRERKIKASKVSAANARWCKPNADPHADRHANTHAPSAYAYEYASVPGPTFGKSENLLFHPDSRAVLHWLNETSGRHFRELDSNLSVISARLGEPEVTLEGVRLMIERQCRKWKGTDKEDYLTPATLFGKEKFDNYYANRNSKINAGTSAKGFDRAKGTLNEGVHEQYNLRKVQAQVSVPDPKRPGA